MSIEDYKNLIARKAITFTPRGLSKIPELNPKMFPYQQACTEFALRTGCAGLFLATGLGKSLCSLDYGRVIVEHTNKPVLMLAPLAVSKQHEREAEKFGIDAKAVRDPSEITGKRIYVTNYERLAKFDADMFSSVILDECFAPDTPIDTLNAEGMISPKLIRDIRVGDKILNASGVDSVSDIHRRDENIALANELKVAEERYLRLLERLLTLNGTHTPGQTGLPVDPRMIALAKTAMQEANMWAVRSIFQPTRIKLPEDKA